MTSSADGGALQTCLAPSQGFPLLPGGDNVVILPCSQQRTVCQAFNCSECIGQLQCVTDLNRGDITCSPCAPLGPNYDLAALALLVGLALLGIGVAQVLCLSARNGFDPSTCRSNHRTGCSAICGTPCSDPWPQAADASGDGCRDGPGYSVMTRQHAPPVILGTAAFR